MVAVGLPLCGQSMVTVYRGPLNLDAGGIYHPRASWTADDKNLDAWTLWNYAYLISNMPIVPTERRHGFVINYLAQLPYLTAMIAAPVEWYHKPTVFGPLP